MVGNELNSLKMFNNKHWFVVYFAGIHWPCLQKTTEDDWRHCLQIQTVCCNHVYHAVFARLDMLAQIFDWQLSLFPEENRFPEWSIRKRRSKHGAFNWNKQTTPDETQPEILTLCFSFRLLTCNLLCVQAWGLLHSQGSVHHSRLQWTSRGFPLTGETLWLQSR